MLQNVDTNFTKMNYLTDLLGKFYDHKNFRGNIILEVS